VTDTERPMDWTLEVVVLPVSDLDRAIAFYRDQVGFDLDHHTTNEFMDIAQLTPRGSGCSIVIGNLPSQNEMAPGSMRGLQLCVAAATSWSRAGWNAVTSRCSTSGTAAPSSGSLTRTATRGPCSSSRLAA
jgi:catechol 2,3-dioxygenase-like lactoylglutathione lyase family enzyme